MTVEPDSEYSSPVARQVASRTFKRLGVQYLAIRTRQLEGTYPGNPTEGTWPSSGMRAMRAFGMTLDEDWPMLSSIDDYPPDEPKGLDTKAKQFQCDFYQRIRDTEEVRLILANQGAVSVSIGITDQWYEADRGIIYSPSSDEEITASHQIVLTGFDVERMCYFFTKHRVKNNWRTHRLVA